MANSPCPLCNSNSCSPMFMKLGENVYGLNILAKFDNQPNRFSLLRVMALYLYKKRIRLVHSLTQTVVVWSSWNLRKMFMGIIYGQCPITSHIALHTSDLWLLIFTKNATLVSALSETVVCWSSWIFVESLVSLISLPSLITSQIITDTSRR